MPVWRQELGKIGAVANQTTRRNVVAQGKDRRHSVASRQRDEFILQTKEKPISANKHCFDLPLLQRCENALDFKNAAGREGNKSQTKQGRRCLQVAQLRSCVWIVRIKEHAYYGRFGGNLM